MTGNARVLTVLGSIPASSDTAESEGQQMKQCWIQYIKKNPPLYMCDTKSEVAHSEGLQVYYIKSIYLCNIFGLCHEQAFWLAPKFMLVYLNIL